MNFRPKLNRTWIILGAALLIGALAAVAARSYLSSQIEAIEARGKGKTVKVIVASRALKRGDKVSSASVAVRDIPVEFAHSVAVTPEAFDRIDGQALAYPVRAGEMILWGLMEGKRVPTFSARVEAGHRAMTVAVDEISSISGLLEPGDLIDLLVTFERKGRKITRPLLQGVQVMATGQQVVDSPREGERRQYSTVTIDITPAQAQNVILARDAGRVTALLRNPDDKKPMAGGNADMTALPGTTTPVASTAADGIPVLYGGMKLTPEALAMGRPAPARVQADPRDDLVLQAPVPGTPPVASKAPTIGAVPRSPPASPGAAARADEPVNAQRNIR
ncbi:MAG: Flp pilus assembly protein CpaB [Herminiimonas sp.]|nr:Flp pilus assembly protein CpaB [Herminiimonas sp.]